MRRNSYYETQDLPQIKKNVGDLIYRYEARNGAHLQEILSPHLQRELEMYYGHRPDLMRLKMRQHNESLPSLTDSEFFSDDHDQASSLTKENVTANLTRLGRFLDFLSRLPLPLSFTGMGICFLFAVFICPRTCCENLLFPAFRLAFGTLYPAYASYKAVRTKNVKEYVKWMMYWIVYAFFTCIETFTDIFLSWFPFYYEFKVIIVLWLLSPATKGSSTLYRKFVHPMLTRREQEIDEYLNQAKERGYTAVLQLGSKGVNYATNVIMQTALKGGGNLVQTIRRSYSLSDLSEPDVHRTQDEIDEVVRPQRLLRPRSQTVRSSSGGRQSMYFSEVDVEPKIPPANYNYIRSSEDISSGYSSAEPISGGLSRTSSMTNATRPRFKAKRAEDQNYEETVEYEVEKRASTSLQFPEFINPLNPSPGQNFNRAACHSSDTLEDWKNEAFFDNELYFQNREKSHGESSTYQARKGESSGEPDTKNMPPEMLEKYQMFCKWLEDNEKFQKTEGESGNNLLKTDSNGENTKTQEKLSEDIKSVQKQSSEEFQDTISTGSANEEFVDVIPETKEDTVKNMKIEEESKILISAKEEISTKKPDAFANVVVLDSNENHQFEKSEDVIAVTGKSEESYNIKALTSSISATRDTSEASCSEERGALEKKEQLEEPQHQLESVLKDIRKQAESTLSEINAILVSSDPSVKLETKDATKPTAAEVKPVDSIADPSQRFPSHGKGKAPEPPNTSPSSLISEHTSSVPVSRSDNLPHTGSPIMPSLRPPELPKHTQLPDLGKTHSRSPSPKPEGKKSKKSLFKNYLPSLFRSESPKTTPQVSDEYHKETQI